MVSPLTTVWESADAGSVQTESSSNATHMDTSFFIENLLKKCEGPAEAEPPETYGHQQQVKPHSWLRSCQMVLQSKLHMLCTSCFGFVSRRQLEL
jgi:hypothetical protein